MLPRILAMAGHPHGCYRRADAVGADSLRARLRGAGCQRIVFIRDAKRAIALRAREFKELPDIFSSMSTGSPSSGGSVVVEAPARAQALKRLIGEGTSYDDWAGSATRGIGRRNSGLTGTLAQAAVGHRGEERTRSPDCVLGGLRGPSWLHMLESTSA